MGYYTKDSSSAACEHGRRPKTAYPRRDFVESGLRFYNPALGRWMSRDPIGERGGLNVYVFVGNEPVGRWDLLGKTPSERWHQFESGIMDVSITFNKDWDAETIAITFVSDPAKVCCSKIDFKQTFVAVNLEGTGDTAFQEFLPTDIPAPSVSSFNVTYKDPCDTDYYLEEGSQGSGTGEYLSDQSSVMYDTPIGGSPSPDTGAWVKLADGSYTRRKVAKHFTTTATCVEGADKGKALGTVEWELTYPSLSADSVAHLVVRGFYE